VEFRILGPLQVLREGRPVALEAPKQRTLLAVLLLHANEVVSTERLVDELWGDRPPPTAVKTLQVHVSQLRKALGGNTIVTSGRGYVARVAAAEIDAARFRDLVAEARHLRGSRNHAEAAQAYRDALALWRGDALADVTLRADAQNELVQLDELRVTAVEERIDCELALGQHQALVDELGRLVAKHPYRERLAAQLLLALYRSGRQADALAAYRSTRRRLAEDLGIEPGDELRRLEQAILRHDPSLEPAPPPHRKQIGRRRRVVGAALGLGAAVLVAAAALAVWQLRDTPAASGSIVLAGNSVAVIDPATARAVGEVPIGGRPAGIALGAGSVWVGNRDAKTLVRIDPDAREIVRTIGLGAQPAGLAFGAGDIWVVTEPDGTVLRVDPGINDVVARIPVPQGKDLCCQARLRFGTAEAWVSRHGDLIRIDPAKNRATKLTSVDDWVWSVTYGDGAVWAVIGIPRRIDRIDPRTRIVTDRFPLDRIGRTDILAGAFVQGGAIWIGAEEDTSVWKVDEGTGRVIGNVDVGHVIGNVDAGHVFAAAFGEGSLWLTTKDTNVLRIDPELKQPVTTIALGVYPAAVEVGQGAVWVAANAP
jgi:DNA-binding SARP family transcriptional activator